MVEVLRKLDVPAVEQVIAMPLISLDWVSQRSAIRRPQKAEQLVEVPTEPGKSLAVIAVQALEIVEDFACESTFLHFSFFHHFYPFFRFFHFLHFFNFSIFLKKFSSCFSFYFIFFHCLSCSLFFFFFFFLVLFLFVGGSNSDFCWNLNFVTISLHISFEKIIFSARLGVPLLPFEASFPFLFLPFFFPLFFSFSFSFSWILFFFSFLFLFLNFSFFLLSSISIRVYCFLRSPCSMEMWCPDDIGRG